MKYTFELQNIKCSGCASSIKNKLVSDSRISEIEVDIKTGVVTIESDTDASAEWLKTMTELGYPEKN